MKCLNKNCDADEIETDDNFCYKCGYRTTKGFTFLNNKENVDIILNGNAAKKDNRFNALISLVFITFIIFFVFCIVRGNDLFKPFFYLKRQLDGLLYGYNVSIIKTNNTYNKLIISDIDDAKEIIKKDMNEQNWKCSNDIETLKYQNGIENKFSIITVNYCDIPSDIAKEATKVINEMYALFPTIGGALTNISITNAKTNSEYIARFEPRYQFVNYSQDINKYNKVNKTQILLNSYYFLNEKLMKNSITDIVKDNWYVKDATWESTIAHEIGHYISFFINLKENGLDNIILVTKENEEKINRVVQEYENGNFAKQLISEALENYNINYEEELNLEEFALTISKYASVKDESGAIIYDETIAEAIHDYYLHGEDCEKSSYEIIKIIKSKL